MQSRVRRVPFVTEEQRQGIVGGHKLRKKLGDSPDDLNAVDMEFLYNHQELIPDSWKAKAIFFWGTIFRRGDDLCVAYLVWRGDRWGWGYGWLDDGRSSCDPAARLAS